LINLRCKLERIRS